MENQAVFLDCPAYLGGVKTVRCGLPAEVEEWYSVGSTDGPLEGVRIRCPRGHWFNGHIESLVMPAQPAAAGVSGRRSAASAPRGDAGGGPKTPSRAHQARGRG